MDGKIEDAMMQKRFRDYIENGAATVIGGIMLRDEIVDRMVKVTRKYCAETTDFSPLCELYVWFIDSLADVTGISEQDFDTLCHIDLPNVRLSDIRDRWVRKLILGE